MTITLSEAQTLSIRILPDWAPCRNVAGGGRWGKRKRISSWSSTEFMKLSRMGCLMSPFISPKRRIASPASLWDRINDSKSSKNAVHGQVYWCSWAKYLQCCVYTLLMCAVIFKQGQYAKMMIRIFAEWTCSEQETQQPSCVRSLSDDAIWPVTWLAALQNVLPN